MRLSAISAILAISLIAAGSAGKEQQPVKIGVLTDLSSLYAAHGGPGSVEAAHMTVEDFGGTVLGKPIERTITTAPISARASPSDGMARVSM